MIDRRTALAHLAWTPVLLGAASRAAGRDAAIGDARLPPIASPRLGEAEATRGTATIRTGVNWGGLRHVGPKPRFRVGNAAQCRNVMLHDVTATGAAEWIVECDEDAALIDSRIERISAECGRGCIRLRGESARVTISDIDARGSLITDTRRLPTGIALDGKARDITITRAIMRGFQTDWGPDRYWNGDGFSSERGNHNIEIRDCAAIDNADGGFDMKAQASRFTGTNLAQGNLRNFRFWESFDAETLVSLEPVKRGGTGGRTHVGLFATSRRTTPIELHVGRLVARAEGSNDAPLFYYDDRDAGIAATIVIDSHDIRIPKTAPLVSGPAAARVDLRWRSGPPRR